MKNSQVTIKGLTRIQANTLALLYEDDSIANLINEKIASFNEDSEDFQVIEDVTPCMDFDNSDSYVCHEVDFS